MDKDLLHIVAEGVLSLLFGGTGLIVKSILTELKELRREKEREFLELLDKIDKLKDRLTAFELQAEKEFVKHSDLHWIKEKLDALEKLLNSVQLAIAGQRRHGDEGPTR